MNNELLGILFIGVISITVSLLTCILSNGFYKSKLREEFKLSMRRSELDKKFDILGELFGLASRLQSDAEQLFPVFDIVPQDETARRNDYRKRLHYAIKSYNEFSTFLLKKAPYLSEELYCSFVDIRKNCSVAIDSFKNELSWNDEWAKTSVEERKAIRENMKENSKKLEEILSIERAELCSWKEENDRF